MTTMRVILEIGRTRRVVAGALDWPGLDRWGTSEDDALEKLAAYAGRYAGVAVRAGVCGRIRAVAPARGRRAGSRVELDRLLARGPRAVADRARGPIQFLVRRTAHHVMDHAWELEDRDLTGLR